MKRRTALTGAATALVTALAGCPSGGDGNTNDDQNSNTNDDQNSNTNDDQNSNTNDDQEPVEPADNSAGERTSQSLRLTVGEDLADSEWQSVSATYPRDQFIVQSAQHEEVGLGVDTSGEGTADEEFDASAISGVNNNDFSFTIELDTGYTLLEGDTVLVEYPAVDNPSEPGEYEVEVSVNEVQTTAATITIESAG